MALTANQILEIREWTGSEPVDASLDTIFLRVGSVEGVALSVLRQRRSESREVLAANPMKLGLAGDYNHDMAGNATVYDDDIARLEELIAVAEANDPLSSGAAIGSATRADRDGLFSSR